MSYNSKEIKVISTAKEIKSNPFKEDVITEPMGQWKYPGEITKIPDRNITMKGVPYPVLGVDNLGNEKMMYPEQDYTFPGETVTEYPQLKKGGHKKLKHHYSEADRSRVQELRSPVTNPTWENPNMMQEGGIQTDDGLRTWDLGELEGKPEDKETKKIIENYRKNPDKQVPGGETYNEFLSRVVPAYNKALATLPDHSLIVTHSQVMKGLGLPELKPGQSHPVKVGDKTIHIIRHGDTPQTNKMVRTKDVPLDTRGVEEARKTAANLADKIKGTIMSSPLPRALTTAEIVKDTAEHVAMGMGGWLDNYRGGGPTPEKAKAMLEDGMVRGHPLTQKQIDFFKTLVVDDNEELPEERFGGLTKGKRSLQKNNSRTTSRNIKTSLNYLMARNFDIYGLSGTRFYDPDAKMQQGGLSSAPTTAYTPTSTQAPVVPTNPTGWDWVAEKWKNREPSNWNFMMPDKYGEYVDSGISPFDALLAVPQQAIKAGEGIKKLLSLKKSDPSFSEKVIEGIQNSPEIVKEILKKNQQLGKSNLKSGTDITRKSIEQGLAKKKDLMDELHEEINILKKDPKQVIQNIARDRAVDPKHVQDVADRLMNLAKKSNKDIFMQQAFKEKSINWLANPSAEEIAADFSKFMNKGLSRDKFLKPAENLSGSAINTTPPVTKLEKIPGFSEEQMMDILKGSARGNKLDFTKPLPVHEKTLLNSFIGRGDQPTESLAKLYYNRAVAKNAGFLESQERMLNTVKGAGKNRNLAPELLNPQFFMNQNKFGGEQKGWLDKYK